MFVFEKTEKNEKEAEDGPLKKSLFWWLNLHKNVKTILFEAKLLFVLKLPILAVSANGEI